jgi:hypothetical protein
MATGRYDLERLHHLYELLALPFVLVSFLHQP